jgi:hypothetical protein
MCFWVRGTKKAKKKKRFKREPQQIDHKFIKRGQRVITYGQKEKKNEESLEM